MPFGIVYQVNNPSDYFAVKDLKHQYKFLIWQDYQVNENVHNITFRTQYTRDQFEKRLREENVTVNRLFYTKPVKRVSTTSDTLFSSYFSL